MNLRSYGIVGGLALGVFGSVPATLADTLLVQRVHEEQGANVPVRGMSMAQVESRFGAPIDKLGPAGGDAPLHPVINRWTYPNYVVYFERDRVIDSVLVQATPTEVGPKNR